MCSADLRTIANQLDRVARSACRFPRTGWTETLSPDQFGIGIGIEQ
jgi:hypothetical protein